MHHWYAGLDFRRGIELDAAQALDRRTRCLTVPDDLALVGFNGLSIGQAQPKPLTAITSQRRKIGFLLDASSRPAGRVAPPRVIHAEFRLIQGSTD